MFNKFVCMTILIIAMVIENIFAVTASDNFNVGIIVPVLCQVNAAELNFGNYDFTADKTATTSIIVTCSVNTAYTVKLSTGQSLNYSTRQMKSGTSILEYNLYTTSGHSAIWGDGTSGTVTVAGTGSGNAITHTVYGKIPHNQYSVAGDYTDTITVTVDY